MVTHSLTLIPYGKQSFTIGLMENESYYGAMERIIERWEESNSIFSDLSYEFVLNGEDIATVQEVRVYINDTYESSTFCDGHICFPDRYISDRRIFVDCYGFVELSLELIMEDGTQHYFRSEYLPVLVLRGRLNDKVKAMVNYVYNHQDSLLLNGEPKPRNMSGLKEGGYKNLTTQIILAEEIATIYETSYGYFKANSRFQIKKTATIDWLEHLQYVTSATLKYIVSHPEQLNLVNSNIGVRMGKRVYQPEKTLSLKNVNSFDIYENRIVLGFLRMMIDEILELKKRCEKLLQQVPKGEDYSNEYIYSSFFMFAETKRMLEKEIQQLSCLYDKFTRLWGMYHDVLIIPVEQLKSEPRSTSIFMSVPQYNRIFLRMHKWFSFGIYDFEKENFMLSFIKISALYENYVLTKLISYFKDCGYVFQESRRCAYPVSKRWKYKNTRCANTFHFFGDQKQITLYYQPVIFDTDQSRVNGIGLYRNNSIPVFTGEEDDNRQGGHYYVPDYLIKIDDGELSKYLIIDAKFSDISNVKRHYVKDLAFKYLFSISPTRKTDILRGMCIVFGKCTDYDELQSVYDNQILGDTIIPFMELLPMIEGMNSEDQYNKLDLIFRKL